MKFEAGKYYKTRSGRKAFVAAVENPFGHGCYQLVGYTEGNSCSACWTERGTIWASGDEHHSDLISEWKEPVTVTKWLLLWSDGTTSLSTTIPLLPVSHLVAFKQVTITEGEGVS